MEEKMTLMEKAIAASKAYLTRRGYEVLNANLDPDEGEFPIVAVSDDGALCFVDVTVGGTEEVPFPAPGLPALRLLEFESAAARFLAEAGDEFVNCGVQCDRVSIHVVSDDRALVRHQIKASCL